MTKEQSKGPMTFGQRECTMPSGQRENAAAHRPSAPSGSEQHEKPITFGQRSMNRTNKPYYTQHHSFARDLAVHAFRFYFLKPDATVDMMSAPTYAAWTACDVVYRNLLPAEQDIVRYYHTVLGGQIVKGYALYQYTKEHGMTERDMMEVVRLAWKLWAIERGLADADGNNTSRANTAGTSTTRTDASGTGTARANTPGTVTTRTGTAGPRMDNTTRTNTTGTAFPGTDFALPNKE